MNTKLYALLLTVVCASGAVQASEENKGDSTHTKQTDPASLIARIQNTNPSLEDLLDSMPDCGKCPGCRAAQRSGSTQPHQENSAQQKAATDSRVALRKMLQQIHDDASQ